jgi:hypothetical protein
MPAWLPIVKVVLPYIGPIVEAALPVFTRKKTGKVDPVIAQQIAELQEAVKANAESSKALAKALEEVALANDKAMQRARSISLVSAGIAAVSLIAVTVLWSLK